MPSIINATAWSTFQRFGSLAIGFISNMVLARLLCPEDFGTVGMIMVFVGLADVLVDGGLGNALIQSKTVSDNDKSTVFTTNLLISVSLFSLIFISAPSIAAYVKIDNFDTYLRVEAIMILIRAFYVVHFSLANRQLAFKTLAGISLTSNFVSTVIAILLAFGGLGVWSLILRNIVIDLTSLILYYYNQKIKVRFLIDRDSFSRLFGYGAFVAIANLIESLYSNILSFIIGKKFSVKELGYYNQAHSLEQIPVYSMTSILNQVIFPFLSKIQDDRTKIHSDIRRSIMCISFIMFPLMVFLICFAKPIIVLLYSDKWLPSVPFFQLLCVTGFFNAFYHLNRSVLKAIGQTRKLFYSQLAVTIIGLSLVVLVLPLGVMPVVTVVVFNSFVSFLIVASIAGRYIQYGVFPQIGDTSGNFIIALISGALIIGMSSIIHFGHLMTLIVMCPLFFVIYLGIHYFIKSEPSQLVFGIAKNYIHRKYSK